MDDDSGGVLDVEPEGESLDDTDFNWGDFRKAHRLMCVWVI